MICRVCLLDSTEYVEIFKSEGIALEIASIISKHFWFEPKVDDPISNIICNTCWQKLDSFNIFYTTVEEAHRKLSERFFIKVDPDIKKEHSDKLETSVVDEEMHFIIKSEPDYIDNENNQQDSPVYMECTKYEEDIYTEEPLTYEKTDESQKHSTAVEEAAAPTASDYINMENKRKNAAASGAERLQLPDSNNCSSGDEEIGKGENHVEKKDSNNNYCFNCTKCICRSWASLATPEIIAFIDAMCATLKKKVSPENVLLRQKEFKVELCPKSNIFISETDKKWAITKSNGKPRSLLINTVLCLVSAEKLIEYGTAQNFVNKFNPAVRKAVLHFVAEETRTHVKDIFNDVINKFIQHQKRKKKDVENENIAVKKIKKENRKVPLSAPTQQSPTTTTFLSPPVFQHNQPSPTPTQQPPTTVVYPYPSTFQYYQTLPAPVQQPQISELNRNQFQCYGSPLPPATK